jgi:hypothetical protein
VNLIYSRFPCFRKGNHNKEPAPLEAVVASPDTTAFSIFSHTHWELTYWKRGDERLETPTKIAISGFAARVRMDKPQKAEHNGEDPDNNDGEKEGDDAELGDACKKDKHLAR